MKCVKWMGCQINPHSFVNNKQFEIQAINYLKIHFKVRILKIYRCYKYPGNPVNSILAKWL